MSKIVYEFELFREQFKCEIDGDKKNDFNRIIYYYKNLVEKLCKDNPTAPELKIAVLAGVKIADELYSLAQKKNVLLPEEQKEFNKIAQEMIKQLDILPEI